MLNKLDRLPVIDGHCDTIAVLTDQYRSLGELSRAGQLDLPRLMESGVHIQFFALFVDPGAGKELPYKLLGLVDRFFRELNDCGPALRLIRSIGDVDSTLLKRGQVGALLAVEGGEVLGDELGVLRILYRLGVRSLTLTWNHRNNLGDGVGVKNPRGLSPFGLEVVGEMNRLGMLVDVAHLAEPGFWDVHKYCRGPYIASHANCRSLCNHPRNLGDDQIVALKSRGGVVGLSFVPQFIHSQHPGLEALLDHVDHIATLAGVDCIGWGSDFDGMEKVTPGLEDAGCLPRLALGLQARGYTNTDIAKIMGGNWHRVIKQVLGQA